MVSSICLCLLHKHELLAYIIGIGIECWDIFLLNAAGITVLWALAASLVPSMQKGNDTARNLHIALNALNVTLFLWQIPTGIDIVFKVFEFTTWP